MANKLNSAFPGLLSLYPASIRPVNCAQLNTAVFMNTDIGENDTKPKEQGRDISEMGDLNLTGNQGGLVIMRDGVVLGGIAVGGYDGGHLDEALAEVGLAVCLS